MGGFSPWRRTTTRTPRSDPNRGSGWYAACETGHPYWACETRKTYKVTEKDAKFHDHKKHGGVETAAVFQSP